MIFDSRCRMAGFSGNGLRRSAHRIRMKFWFSKIRLAALAALVAVAVASAGCIKVKQDKATARLLKTENATRADLMREVDRFARVDSMRAKMDLKFEDNSFAEFGSKEVYRQADGEVVVQRPGMILLKVQVPIIKSDVAQMSSDGEQFRVAILQDGGSGKYKKFIKGTNAADYSKLQKGLTTAANGDATVAKENLNAFANLRPQHFTDAMLVRPIGGDYLYTQSTIYQVEEDRSVEKKSPIRTVTRGYYLLDEFAKAGDDLKITRRFWFDRVGGVRLARQQIFDASGEIESDIVYGKEGSLTNTGNFANLPLEIQVTRPKERYSMKLTYQSPQEVMIGRKFPLDAFVLKNSWSLQELDLDQKLAEGVNVAPSAPTNSAANHFQP